MAINLKSYDHENVRISINGRELVTNASVSYSHGLEVEKQFGAARKAYGRTEGVYTAEDAELTLGWAEGRNLIQFIGTDVGPDGLPFYLTEESAFDMTVSYAKTGEPLVVDTLRGCRIITYEDEASQGSEGLESSITLSVMELVLGVG